MKNSYDLAIGDIIAKKYRITGFLGSGWEGEVFKIQELRTGIERAAKFFHPKRNKKGSAAKMYAKKLHKLRSCPVLIQYHNTETVIHNDIPVMVFISEYVEGELLSKYLKGFRANTMPSYQALHLLYSLVVGIESIHLMGEYHGDIHEDNVIVERFGLSADIKLLDLYHSGRRTKEDMQNDIICAIKLFHYVIGGQKKYAKQNDIVHDICCGLKHGLILKKFPTASHLKWHLESIDFS